MRNKTSLYLAIGFFTLSLLLLLLMFTLNASASGKVAQPGQCQQGEICYWQMDANSEAYILCANGHFTVDINGDDSILIYCIE